MSQLAVIGRCLISRAKMRFRDEAGFNLITLSLALAFIGLLAAGILAQEKATRDAEKRQITEERLNDIEQAQDIFIERNQRLACPAAFDAAEDTEFFGRERLNTSGTYDIAEDCVIGSPPTSAGVIAVNDSSGQNTVRIGAVPVRSLNLPDDHLYDGWGNPFTYAVSANLTSSAPDPSSPGKTYYEARPGTLRLADPADNILASDIAYYVVSHGDDGTGHYSFGNTIQSQPCTGPGLDRENCNNDGIFRSFAAGASYADRNTPEIYADATTADHFDDAFRTAGKTKVTPPAINKYILDEMPCLSENAIRSDPRPNRNSPTSIRYTATSANARGENCASSAFAGHAYGDASGNLGNNGQHDGWRAGYPLPRGIPAQWRQTLRRLHPCFVTVYCFIPATKLPAAKAI
ncbi:MAG: hypothetical protein LRY39_00135 [Alphaproteobacteria bacterium]|nr:hypothetical protein [Alphaproteobacteria bacterium]